MIPHKIASLGVDDLFLITPTILSVLLVQPVGYSHGLAL
jgi:hypothetical protein